VGQTSPAIAEIEAVYEHMWAQDTEAMYSHAAYAAGTTRMTAFAPPPAVAGPAGRGAAVAQPTGRWKVIAVSEVVADGHQVVAAIPEALQALCLSPAITLDACLSPVTSSLSRLSSLSAPSDFAIGHVNSLNKGAALNRVAALRSLLTKPDGAGGAPLTASLGRATSMGTLSVPQAWIGAVTRSPVASESMNRGWVGGPRPLGRHR
jgi:PPE-repeat protein